MQRLFISYLLSLLVVSCFCQGGKFGNGASVRLYKCPYAVRGQAGATIRFPAEVTKSEEPLSFKIQQGFKRCPGKNTTQEIDYESDSGKFSINSAGRIRVKNEYFTRTEFCIHDFSSKHLTVITCDPPCTGQSPCIKKCCEIGQYFDEDVSSCIPEKDPDSEWKPRFYEYPDKEVTGPDWDSLQPHVSRNFPLCSYPNKSRSREYDIFPSVPVIEYSPVVMRLRKDGALMFFRDEVQIWATFPPGTFCVDEFDVTHELNATQDESYDLPNTTFLISRPFVAIMCSNFNDESNFTSILVYVIALYISAFFLFLTALVYGLLWDKHNVHGWTILCHVISMFLLYVFVGTSHLLPLVLGSDELMMSRSCKLIGITCHFFFISTFCWLTLINIDLWSTFRSHKPAGERSKGKVRFLMYNVIAWGTASVIVGTSVALDTYYPDGFNNIPVPEYGRISCFISSGSKGYYLYNIIGILMAVNVVFIILTSWTICKFRETTRMVQSSRSSDGHQSFKLFAKLFIVMGVTWIFEVVSWPTTASETAIYWILCDIVNICQGIAIFVIFICKKKSMKQLKQRLSGIERHVTSRRKV